MEFLCCGQVVDTQLKTRSVFVSIIYGAIYSIKITCGLKFKPPGLDMSIIHTVRYAIGRWTHVMAVTRQYSVLYCGSLMRFLRSNISSDVYVRRVGLGYPAALYE